MIDLGDDIAWRWTPHAICDCRIVAAGGLQAECLLDQATWLLQKALLDDCEPDFTELARLIGARGALIEIASPQMPSWWFRI
jgi:hypothetical protein